jgi:hypothetical protein
MRRFAASVASGHARNIAGGLLRPGGAAGTDGAMLEASMRRGSQDTQEQKNE